MLRAVAKHSPQLAQAVVACGGVEALVLSLEDFDPGVKEAVSWALGYVARHNERKRHLQTRRHYHHPQHQHRVGYDACFLLSD